MLRLRSICQLVLGHGQQSQLAECIRKAGTSFNRPSCSSVIHSKQNENDKSAPSGLFNYAGLNSPNDLHKLFKQTKHNCDEILQEIFHTDHSGRATVTLVDDLSNAICLAADLTECIRLLHPDETWQEAAEQSMGLYTQLVESLNTRRDLYELLAKSAQNEDELDEIDQTVARLLLHDFQQSGVHLPPEKQLKFVQLSSDIFELGSEFSKNVEQPTEVPNEEIDNSERRVLSRYVAFDKSHGNAIVQEPLLWVNRPDVRMFGYKHHNKVNKRQSIVLSDLLDRRHNLAVLTGNSSYADRVQAHTLMGNADNAHEFLSQLLAALRPLVSKEVSYLRSIASPEPLQICDLHYLSSKYRNEQFALSPADYAPFFKLDQIVLAFGKLMQEIYGCRLERVDADSNELWSTEVCKYNVLDENHNLLGEVYGDFSSRANKYGGDCHVTVRCSKQLSGGRLQRPLVVLSLSLQPNQYYCSPAQGENIWHELGHALHSMFGSTRYQHVAGTRCSTDLAEVPSNLMECFFYDTRVLQTCFLDCHNEPMAQQTAQAIVDANKAFQCTELQQQTINSMIDLELHMGAPMSEQTMIHRYNELCAQNLDGLVPPAGTFWPHRFGHLVPYAARYYCYLVAQASASLIWQTLFQHNPFNKEAGLAWRKIQARGGEIPTNQLLSQVLGFEPSSEHLIEALYRQAEHNTKLSSRHTDRK